MSVNSERLRELTEEKIGEGNSKQIFGRHWEKLYEVLSEEEGNLTEEMIKEGLEKCEFKDPEAVGFLALICPLICTPIIDRIMGKMMREFYKFILSVWYFMLIITIVSSITKWEMDREIPIMILSMIITSWAFRRWSREWNNLELIYRLMER